MSAASAAEALKFAAEFLRARNREEHLRGFAERKGLAGLMLFIPDTEVGLHLAAPGFPQTLPRGALWKEFIGRCLSLGECEGHLPWKENESPLPAYGVGCGGYALVLLGEGESGALIHGFRMVLPLLGAALAGERAILAQAAQADIAAQAAREATLLAERLDEARRAAQREAAARARAERELQRKLEEQKHSEQELRRARDALESMNKDLDARVREQTASLREALTQMEEFSYSVSHDLRAPLRAMNAYADVLLEEYAPHLDHQARCYLERIRKSSQRMEQLTFGLLRCSRVVGEHIEVTRVNLDTMIRDLIAQYQHFQPPAAEIKIHSPLTDVVAHELLLAQAVTNLLSNAVKFVKPGMRPEIHISTQDNGDSVRLWIEDNGIGIHPRHQDRVFKIFERIHPEQSFEGTGIGLAMVRKSVEKMGGKTGVISDGKQGSRFWIELPKA